MKRLLIFGVFALCACQPPNGTGTGNPFSNGAPDAGVEGSVSGLIFGYTCQLLMKCNSGLSAQSCGIYLAGTVGFGPKLGIANSEAMTAEDILNAEGGGRIKADVVQGDKCSAAILRMQCSNPVVQAAYDPSSIAPMEHAPDMLNSVCTGVFKP